MGIFQLVLSFVILSSVAVSFHAIDQEKTPLWGVLVLFTGLIGLVIYAISLASD